MSLTPTDIIEPDVTRAADHIAEAWRTGIEAIIETGGRLFRQRDDWEREPGKWNRLIGNNQWQGQSLLPFSAQWAYRLIKIYETRDRLINYSLLMPSDVNTLHGIAQLEEGRFLELIDAGVIYPGMKQTALAASDRIERRKRMEAELGTKQLALPDKKYGVILADPEWDFETYTPFGDKSSTNPAHHFPVSSIEDIKARDIPSIAADDCVLFLWATSPILLGALSVMEAWGFTYKSHQIWVKDKIGTGYWFRNKHELLLVGTRGSVPAPAMGTQENSVFEAPVGRHSEKPEQVSEMIERLYPTLPKIELNARRERPGWDVWGNDVTASEAAA